MSDGNNNITTGEIVEALNNKVDLDLNNIDTTSGVDWVIEYQMPDSTNDYIWYRKYKSGWVEQGGVNVNATQDYQVNLPIPMSDTNYVVSITGHSFSSNNNGYIGNVKSDSLTTTGFKIQGRDYSNGSYQTKAKWYVCGVAA